MKDLKLGSVGPVFIDRDRKRNRLGIVATFAVPALIACCLLNQRSFKVDWLQRIANAVYPFLKAELYLPWASDQLDTVLQANLDLLSGAGLVQLSEDGRKFERAEGGTAAAGQLNLLARSLLQTLERYYITIAVLAKNGSATLSRGELEKLCILTAQRISQLHEFEAPEFYDQKLFRQFIGQLRTLGYLTNTEDGKLEFGDALDEIGRDARFILSKEIRHGIARIAPQGVSGEQGSETPLRVEVGN